MSNGLYEKALSIQYVDVTPPREKKPARFHNFFRAWAMKELPEITGAKRPNSHQRSLPEAKIKSSSRNFFGFMSFTVKKPPFEGLTLQKEEKNLTLSKALYYSKNANISLS